MATNTIQLTITPNGGSATKKELTLARERGTTGPCLFRSYDVAVDDQRHDLPIFSQSDWSGGMGDGNFGDPTRFCGGYCVNTEFPGQLFLGPLVTTTDVLNATVVSHCYFGSAWYALLSNGDIYKWNTTNSHWDLAFDGASVSAHPQALCSHGGYMFVARGSNAYLYTNDGTNYTMATTADKDATGFLSAPAATGIGTVLWKFGYSNNQIASHSTGLNGTEWSTPAYIGESSNVVTSLILHQDRLLVGTTWGLYHYDSDGATYKLLGAENLSDPGYSGNFKYHTHLKGSTYFSMYNQIGELTGGNAFRYVEPTQFVEDYDLVLGKCEGLAADQDNLYACFRPSGLLNSLSRSNIYKGHEVASGDGTYWSWGHIAETPAGGYDVQGLFVSPALGSTHARLWWGGGDLASDYIQLPRYPIASSKIFQSDTITFTPTGYLETGWIDLGHRDWYKLIDSVLAEAKMNSGAMSATKYVRLSYATDDSTSFTTIGDITTATMGTKKYIATAPVAAKKVKFRITLVTDSSSVTPIVKYFAAYGSVRPTRVRMFDFTVFAEQGQTGMTKDIRDFLIDGRDSTTLVTLVDRFGASHYVRILPGYPQETELCNQEGKQVGIVMRVVCEKVDWA